MQKEIRKRETERKSKRTDKERENDKNLQLPAYQNIYSKRKKVRIRAIQTTRKEKDRERGD